MRYFLVGLTMVVSGITATGQDMEGWSSYGFLEGADLISDVYSTDLEVGAGLGLMRALNRNQGIGLEIFVGPNFSNNDMTNTFAGWDVDWKGLDLIFRHQWAETWSASGGVGYAVVDEQRRGRDFGVPNNTELEHRGPTLSVNLTWHFVPRSGVFLKYRRFVGTVEDLPSPRPRYLADAGDPEYIALGIFWRFF